MSQHDDHVSIEDMLNHADEAVKLLGSATLEQLVHDRVLQLALTRLVELVGEAASRVSGNLREQNPDIPWSEMIGMRNRLIHGYDIISYSVLWDTVNYDLPPLVQQLRTMLED